MHASESPPLTSANLYDVVRYPSHVHLQTHPERLATLGRLHGIQVAPPTACRVLEIGCGNASNLVPMAWALPGSSFTGIDLAERPLVEGRELAAHLGLKNLKLQQLDLMNLDTAWGEFDYIICHGVYSWVPEPVRDRLLAVCRQCLAPKGIAFISYNALPGAQFSIMLREMMLFHAGQIVDPEEKARQAMALIQLIADANPSGRDVRTEWIRVELKRLLDNPPAQVFHDELAPCFAPILFTDFARHAAGHNLQFVTEADFPEMSDQGFSPEAQRALRQLAGDRIRHEQYRDFLKLRRFRQTLLTHRENAVRSAPDPDAVTRFMVSLHSPLTASNNDLGPIVATHFTARPSGQVETDFPIGKAALHHLIQQHPAAVSVQELTGAVAHRLRDAGIAREAPGEIQGRLNPFLLQLYGRGLIRLHSWYPQLPRHAAERPVASPIARWQIQHEPRVTSLTHRTVEVEDAIGQSLLALLDGTRDRPTLCEAIYQKLHEKKMISRGAATPELIRAEIAERLEANLQLLADVGLLIS